MGNLKFNLDKNRDKIKKYCFYLPMPIIYQKQLPNNGELGVWKITESENFFEERLQLFPEEAAQLAEIKGRLRLEWMASRWLLHTMSGRKIRGACVKDVFGKPYLTDSPFDISISHSWDVVTVMAAPYSIGVDIQKEVGKIARIAPKFMRPVEKESLVEGTKIPHLHIYWGAKEALYKAYGRKELGFIEHIHIDPFAYDLQVGQTTGAIHKGSYHAYFDVFYEKVANSYLVTALEQTSS
ncbi:MAG: 4'-phosphopantetheinyl transferase superfamily protein [Bacteroidota bacterium]